MTVASDAPEHANEGDRREEDPKQTKHEVDG